MTTNPTENNVTSADAATPQGQSVTEEAQQLLAGKYHSVDALEQGYRELSRLVREKSPQAPESYDVDLSEFLPEGSDPVSLESDGLWQHITPTMREAGLTNNQAEAVTKAFLTYQQQQVQHEQKALEAMGVEGQHMVQQVRHFIENGLEGDEQGMAHQLASTVDGVKFLNKIALMAGEKNIPTESAGAALDVDALKDKAKAMMNDPELKYNRTKQEAYNNLWKDITALSK